MKMVGSRVEVVSSKGCSRMFSGTSSLKGMQLQPSEPVSPALSFSSAATDYTVVRSNGPFSGLVICVTGLSKEARNQVKEATERLGGQYSPQLHPHCTHLVVQSSGGRKLEHALKHGSKNGLILVTLGWFVDSVRKNVRLNESDYSVKKFGQNATHMNDFDRLVGSTGAENSCLPAGLHESPKQLGVIEESPKRIFEAPKRSLGLLLSNHLIYVDLEISPELRTKVVEAASREGAEFANKWFAGSHVSHVVCDGPSVRGYLGHSSNIVTPLWVLKTAKERKEHRLVHISADLARQVGMMLENDQNGITNKEIIKENVYPDVQNCREGTTSQRERQQIVDLAKGGVRNRRGRRMQTCQIPIRPITPSVLLDFICWSISEPTSTASIYTDSTSAEEFTEHPTTCVFFDAKIDEKESETSFANFSRPLKEMEKTELIFKNHFLTILFPLDRFSEMGPSSRTFYSEKGFSCLKVLDFIYEFYQENMTSAEIEAAIHTDSRHADRLRSVYSSKETAELGYVIFKRIDFLGSRRSFELLKRVNGGDNNTSIYELLIRA